MKKTLFSWFALTSIFNVYADDSNVLFYIETTSPTNMSIQRTAINAVKLQGNNNLKVQELEQALNKIEEENVKYSRGEELSLNPYWQNMQELQLNAIHLSLINKINEPHIPVVYRKVNDEVYSIYYSVYKNNISFVKAEKNNKPTEFIRYTFIDNTPFSVFTHPSETESLMASAIGCYTNKNNQVQIFGKRSSHQKCKDYIDQANQYKEFAETYHKYKGLSPDNVTKYTMSIFGRNDIQRYQWKNIKEIMPKNAKENSLSVSFDKNNKPVTLFYSYDIPYNDGFLQYSNNFYFKNGDLISGESSYIFKKDNYSYNREIQDKLEYIFYSGKVFYFKDNMNWIFSPTLEDEIELSRQETKFKENRNTKRQALILGRDMPKYTQQLLKTAYQLKPKSTKKDCAKHIKFGEICTYSLP